MRDPRSKMERMYAGTLSNPGVCAMMYGMMVILFSTDPTQM